MTPKAHALRRLLAPLAGLLIGLASMEAAGCSSDSVLPTSPTTSQAPLAGDWVLVASDRPGNPSGIGIRRKTFTATTWSITQPNPDTGVVVFHHGGTYTLDGTNYSETVTFANASTASLIGQTFTYQVHVNGDTYAQTDGVWNEVWQRVMP